MSDIITEQIDVKSRHIYYRNETNLDRYVCGCVQLMKYTREVARSR